MEYPKTNIGLPLIDLDEGLLLTNGHAQIVDQARSASEEWGFFQVVNHGIPVEVLEDMLAGIRKFNEEDIDAKRELYSRDRTRRVRFNSNHDLFQSQRADWRDTLSVSMLASDHVDPHELPESCRYIYVCMRVFMCVRPCLLQPAKLMLRNII